MNSTTDFGNKTYRRGRGETQRMHLLLFSALLGVLRGEICLDPLRQAAALNELHAEVMLPFMLSNFVNRHDVRMIQVSRRFGFTVKAMHVRLRCQLPGENHLESNDAVE